MDDPKWKRFEKVIHEIHAQFAPAGATVTLNEKILGFDSQTERQIDVSIRLRVSGYDILIVVECKDWGRPIDVAEMGSFGALLKDVRANKGVMVSVSGFTPSALKMAEAHGIETRTYVDTESQDWSREVAIPVLLKRSEPYRWAFQFSNVGSLHFELPTTIPPAELEMFTEDGLALGTLGTLLGKVWNKERILYEPGEYNMLLGEHLTLRTGETTSHLRVEALMLVKIRHYLGPVALRVRGLIDEQAHKLTTNRILTEAIEPRLVELGKIPGWREIPNIEQLSIRPVMTIGYSDVLPDGTPLTEDSAD